ncbi:MAG: hypothetical protein ACRCZ2_02845 [Fusobacteriaceae bacterium]
MTCAMFASMVSVSSGASAIQPETLVVDFKKCEVIFYGIKWSVENGATVYGCDRDWLHITYNYGLLQIKGGEHGIKWWQYISPSGEEFNESFKRGKMPHGWAKD